MVMVRSGLNKGLTIPYRGLIGSRKEKPKQSFLGWGRLQTPTHPGDFKSWKQVPLLRLLLSHPVWAHPSLRWVWVFVAFFLPSSCMLDRSVIQQAGKMTFREAYHLNIQRIVPVISFCVASATPVWGVEGRGGQNLERCSFTCFLLSAIYLFLLKLQSERQCLGNI